MDVTMNEVITHFLFINSDAITYVEEYWPRHTLMSQHLPNFGVSVTISIWVCEVQWCIIYIFTFSSENMIFCCNYYAISF